MPNSQTLFPATAITVEAWLKPDYTGCSRFYRIIHTVQNPAIPPNTFTGYHTLLQCDGKFVAEIYDNTGARNAITSNAVIPAGIFTHVAFTWDGSNLQTYINGNLDNTIPTTIYAIGSNSFPIRIGNDAAVGFKGQIDETAIYNRALSASEIQSIFSAGSDGKCLAPTAASVPVGGRVTTANGRGISRARVELTDARGETRMANTNLFGYYRFETVAAGETYVLSVKSKRHTFASNTSVLFISEDVADVNFTALP
jgi:hypothetical protein